MSKIKVKDLTVGQKFIMETYPALLIKYTIDYCSKCAHKERCILLPVTTKGEVCPYYEKASQLLET